MKGKNPGGKGIKFSITKKSGAREELTAHMTIELAGVPGFAVHSYRGFWCITHMETGAFFIKEKSKGEMMVRAKQKAEELGKLGILIAISRAKSRILEQQDGRKQD